MLPLCRCCIQRRVPGPFVYRHSRKRASILPHFASSKAFGDDSAAFQAPPQYLHQYDATVLFPREFPLVLSATLLNFSAFQALNLPLSPISGSVQDWGTRCAVFEVFKRCYSVPVPATVFARLHFCSKRPPCLKESPWCSVQHISSEPQSRVTSHCLTQRSRVTHFK